MTALLIADLHLSPDRPEVTRGFLRFLEHRARHASALYILGDLFEAWIGDDDPSPLAREVVAALRAVSDGGTALYFIHGNRDFLVGKRFARETGVTLLPEHSIAELGGQRVLLLHGDTLCLEDIDYQKFRRKVRSRPGTWLLGHLPLKKRLQIAADWRAQSREFNSNKADHIMDVSQSEVDRLLRKFGVNTMIHGHTHRPAVHPLELDGRAARRIVLGDWDAQGWAIEAAGDQLTLASFPLTSEGNPASAG